MNWYKKLDPRVRVATSIMLMILSFGVESIQQVIISFVLVVILFGTNGFKMKSVGKILLPFSIFLGILTLVNMLLYGQGEVILKLGPISITDLGLNLSLLYSYRLGLMFMLGAFLIKTTTQTEIADSFESLLSPLKVFGVPVREIALVFSLALRFIPTLTDEARQLKEAQMSRGASLNTGSIFARISALIANIIPIFAGAIRHADALSLALEARGWNMSEKRGHLHPMKMQTFDWVYILFVVGLIIATNLTNFFA